MTDIILALLLHRHFLLLYLFFFSTAAVAIQPVGEKALPKQDLLDYFLVHKTVKSHA